MMELLFTGGTGFVGRAVLRLLMARAAQGGVDEVPRVTVLSRNPERFLASHPEFAGLAWLGFHRGDVERFGSLPHGTRFTHIVHAATDSTDAAQLTVLQRYDQIVQGTRNLLQFAAENGVLRFLLTSSGGVYGPQPPTLECIPEDYCAMPDPLVAGNVYGVSKRAAEHLCALYGAQFGIETVIARCFAFVGEDLPIDAHFAIGNFIRDALFADEITVGGDGTPVRSYMDQSELARWLLALLERGAAGRAYNVGSDEALTIAELAHRVRDRLAPQKPVKILARAGTDSAGRNRYLPDISRVRAELGLRNEIGLDEAIERAAAGIRARRALDGGMTARGA